ARWSSARPRTWRAAGPSWSPRTRSYVNSSSSSLARRSGRTTTDSEWRLHGRLLWCSHGWRMDGGTESALRRPHRESIAAPVHTWPSAEAALAHTFVDPERAAYERAVATVLADLRRCRTVGELLGSYALDRRAVHAAVFAACTSPDGAPRLLASVVEGAAFWR